jgi:excisionase family DNA binding protein
MELPTTPQAADCRLCGIKRAATYLDITPRSIYRLVDRGIIKPIRLPGMRRTLFDKRDLDALVDSGKRQPASAVSEQAIEVGAEE